jgi:CHASE3 domain sensor protein
MTIAKRLVLLLVVPLLALVGLGVFARWHLTTIETSSRFVAEAGVQRAGPPTFSSSPLMADNGVLIE